METEQEIRDKIQSLEDKCARLRQQEIVARKEIERLWRILREMKKKETTT